jgi:hypothetical protein
MEEVYKKYKGKLVKYPEGVEGIVCGYTNDNLLIATHQKPIYGFRKFNKEESFVEEQYKDSHYKYCYCLEATLIAQYPRIK